MRPRWLALLALVLLGPGMTTASMEPAAMLCGMGLSDFCVARWIDRLGLEGGQGGFEIAVHPGGAFVAVAGVAVEDDGRALLLTLSDAHAGARRWVRTFVFPGGDLIVPVGLLFSPDGATLYATGMLQDGDADVVVLAADAATGAARWTARYGGAGQDIPAALDLTPTADRVLVAGVGSNDLFLAAFESATGALAWEARYDGPDHLQEDISNVHIDPLAIAPDGTAAYVAFASQAAVTGMDAALAAFDLADGRLRWVVREDAGPSGFGAAAEVSADSEVVYTSASTWVAGGNYDILVRAYGTEAGDLRWAQRHNHPSDQAEGPVDLLLAPDGGRLFVVGLGDEHALLPPVELAGELQPTIDLVREEVNHGLLTNWSYVAAAYDATTGEPQWSSNYSGPLGWNNLPWGAALSHDGRHLYVTGESIGFVPFGVEGGAVLGFYDYATVAFDAATGAQVWVARYDGTAHGWDTGTAVAADPARHRVFVTGVSPGTETGEDLVTIAYDVAPN